MSLARKSPCSARLHPLCGLKQDVSVTPWAQGAILGVMGSRACYAIGGDGAWKGLWAGCLLALAPLAPAQDEDTEVRPFALPDTRAVRGLVAAVEDHIAAERMEDASARLQELSLIHI